MSCKTPPVSLRRLNNCHKNNITSKLILEEGDKRLYFQLLSHYLLVHRINKNSCLKVAVCTRDLFCCFPEFSISRGLYQLHSPHFDLNLKGCIIWSKPRTFVYSWKSLKELFTHMILALKFCFSEEAIHLSVTAYSSFNNLYLSEVTTLKLKSLFEVSHSQKYNLQLLEN